MGSFTSFVDGAGLGPAANPQPATEGDERDRRAEQSATCGVEVFEGRQQDVSETSAEHERWAGCFKCQQVKRGSGSPRVPGRRLHLRTRPPYIRGIHMRTTFHSRKRTATIGAALTAVLALALTACNGDDYASGSTQAGPQILKEGETAAFHITFPVNNSGGSGVRLTDMAVTPPNEIEPFTLTWPAGTLAVTDGEDSGKLEISPVGKVSDSPAG